MNVTLPSFHSPEIQYTFDILLEEFLGLNISYSYSSNPKSDFIIESDGAQTVIIKNQFFSKFNIENAYIHKSSFPKGIPYWTDSTLGLINLPVLYGETKMVENQNQYILHADIIASSFFMLARWEETVDDQKDEHNRSTGKNSIAYKYEFLHRPVVNEYADLLWKVLTLAGYKGTRKKHHYTSVITHDVDQPYQWPSWKTNIKHLAGDLLKRKNFKMFASDVKSLYHTAVLGQKDPFDNHEYLISLANDHGYQAHFNFIISARSRYDQSLSISDPRLKSLINRIETNGHIIGYHPGYTVFTDELLFKRDLDQLQSMVSQKIVSGRQHYLRFSVPNTWKIWEAAGMEWESSMGYSDLPGFRCGTCYAYPVYDCIERKKLKLREKPLIVMDATLVHYLKSVELTGLNALKEECKKHGGEWLTIWHNDLVGHPLLKDFHSLILK